MRRPLLLALALAACAPRGSVSTAPASSAPAYDVVIENGEHTGCV